MKKRVSAILLALVLVFGLLPATALAAEGESTTPAVYVSSAGDDTNGNGSEDKPFATLAKAVGEAVDGATIYVMSDLTMTSCARFYNKSLTITSLGDATYTITRGDNFAQQQDNARSWYNPAMVEVQTTGGVGAGLTLTNIIFDDAGKASGTVFAQTVSDDGTGTADTSHNTDYVQDAIIASNATVPSTITLGKGAVLRNFGGMSAVRATGAAKLVMESGSVIEDAPSITRSKGDAGSVGTKRAAPRPRYGKEAEMVLKTLAAEPQNLAQLAGSTGIPLQELTGILLALEIDGVIAENPPGVYMALS